MFPKIILEQNLELILLFSSLSSIFNINFLFFGGLDKLNTVEAT